MKSKKSILLWIVFIFLTVSFVGFVDATYLTVKHFQGETPACSVLEGCDKVTSSEYAVILGIPVALLGSLYYLTVFLLSIAYMDRRNEKVLFLTSIFTTAGLLASAWFVYLQFYVIGSICLYCMGSATTSTLLFIIGMFTLYTLRKPREESVEQK